MGDEKHKYFLAYLNQPVSKENLELIINVNNIKHDRCVLYKYFVISLITIIFDTYLGEEFTDEEQQLNHFKWCWAKNVNNFIKEGVRFEEEKLYDYFLNFMLEVYYTNDNPDDLFMEKTIKFWSELFNIERQKTNADVDTLLEIYKIFDSSLKMS